MKKIIVIICLSLLGCLEAKKSAFDISSPSLFGTSFFISVQNSITGSSNYTVGGLITGFTNGTLVIQNNGSDDLTLNAGATSFQFATGLVSGANYAVSIKTQPSGLTCSLTNPSGTIAFSNVTNIAISCVTVGTTTVSSFTVGGTISGFTSGTMVLQNNAANDLTLNGGVTSFQFATGLVSGANYSVSIKTQPSGLTCTLTNPSGTIASANVTNIAISCVVVGTTTVSNFTVGGTISGFTSGTLVLQNNASNDLTLNGGVTSFQFATGLASGANYSVSIKTQPSGLTCSLANPSGTIASTNVINVNIVCSVTTYLVGGTITGFTSGTLVLRNNGANDLTINANATSFQFTTAVATGAGYTVTVLTQPSVLTCSLANPSGTIGAANVTNVSITCATTTYTVGGTIPIATNFIGGTLVLQNNGVDDLNISGGATSFQFPTVVATGATYAVTVKQHPTGYLCSLTGATGTATVNIMSVGISCAVAVVSALYPTNGANWNDYINRDFSKDIFSQTDTTCNTANTGGYRTCVHGGEIRKFDLPSRSTCTGLVVTDSLSAMNWICKPNSTTGGVTFYTTALKKGKYLSDLIDWTANNWQNLTITVKEGTTNHAVTNPLKLWNNPIDTTETTTPSTAGTVYLYGLSTITNNITLNASKVSVLINPSGIKSIRTTGACNLIAGINITNQSFIWLEGMFDFGDSNQNAYGVFLSTAKFSVLKNVKIQNAGKNCIATGNSNKAINLDGSINNYFEDIVLTQTLGTSLASGIGLSLSTSDDNLINGISISNMATDGIVIKGSKSNTILNATVMSSAAECVLIVSNSQNNSILNISTVNTNNFGIRSVDSNSGLFVNTVVFNHQNHGISLFTANSITVHNIAASNNLTAQINLNSTGSYFTGIVKTSTNACLYTTSTGGVSSTCQPVTPSDFTAPLAISSISNTFVGYSAIDSKNSTSGLSGNASGLSFASMTDWVRFDHLYKGIGKFNSAVFPSTNHLGICIASINCTIWDLSLKLTDIVLRNANISSSGAACPTAATMFTHTFTNRTVTILRNSVELINDGVGNDDGLCEANEDCLLTPNIGAYQGHGNIVAASTISGCADVTTQGIKLFQYETNGY